MNTRVAWLIVTSWRSLARSTVLGLLPMVVGVPMAWAQTEPVAQDANSRRQDLRSLVRQPQAASVSTGDKAHEQHHLNAQERSQLRRQLTRELRAQSAAMAQPSRP